MKENGKWEMLTDLWAKEGAAYRDFYFRNLEGDCFSVVVAVAAVQLFTLNYIRFSFI
jgi:hypothetical protein